MNMKSCWRKAKAQELLAAFIIRSQDTSFKSVIKFWYYVLNIHIAILISKRIECKLKMLLTCSIEKYFYVKLPRTYIKPLYSFCELKASAASAPKFLFIKNNIQLSNILYSI